MGDRGSQDDRRGKDRKVGRENRQDRGDIRIDETKSLNHFSENNHYWEEVKMFRNLRRMLGDEEGNGATTSSSYEVLLVILMVAVVVCVILVAGMYL